MEARRNHWDGEPRTWRHGEINGMVNQEHGGTGEITGTVNQKHGGTGEMTATVNQEHGGAGRTLARDGQPRIWRHWGND